MPIYSTSLPIDAPADAVWSLLSDVAAWAEWLPTVASVDALDGPVLRPDARFLVRQPRLRPATWVVTALDPPRRFV